MDQVWLAFLITTLAGLSTVLGSILIFYPRKTKKIIVASLSFAAAVMTTVSFTDLIPESYNLLNKLFFQFPTIILILIFMNIGVLVSFLIDKFIPESKAEEGSLFKVGIFSMLAIILHNIPEGIATFMASNTNTHLGIALGIAIALHNIPEGISISVPLYYATGSKRKAILYTFISGLSELFGAVITYLFLKPFINDYIMGFLLAFIAGIMLHIALIKLLPTSLRYNFKKISLFFFIVGIIFMLTNHILFS